MTKKLETGNNNTLPLTQSSAYPLPFL